MKHNAIIRYKHVCKMLENPIGNDSLERELVRSHAKKTKADMEEHFRTARKYANDHEIKALLLGMTLEEYEAKLKAEQEAKLKAEQEAKLKAEQEAKLKEGSKEDGKKSKR